LAVPKKPTKRSTATTVRYLSPERDLKEDGKGLKIVRQSLPYGTASGTHGLYFCAYCARLHNIEQQLLSMFGDTDGKRDAMLRFTKPVTGGYYFAPSLERLLAL
jgi:putative iron-dependent peroxidase